jgi:DNA-binding transcriptional ArsR family regulator
MTDPFEILAVPTRRRIVEVLRTGEHSVNDLVRKMRIDQPGVSKQLRVLHQAGFVDVRPDGQRRLYSLRPQPFLEIDAWMRDYRHVWEGRLDRLAAQLEKKRRPSDDTRERQDLKRGRRQSHDRRN